MKIISFIVLIGFCINLESSVINNTTEEIDVSPEVTTRETPNNVLYPIILGMS